MFYQADVYHLVEVTINSPASLSTLLDSFFSNVFE